MLLVLQTSPQAHRGRHCIRCRQCWHHYWVFPVSHPGIVCWMHEWNLQVCCVDMCCLWCV